MSLSGYSNSGFGSMLSIRWPGAESISPSLIFAADGPPSNVTVTASMGSNNFGPRPTRQFWPYSDLARSPFSVWCRRRAALQVLGVGTEWFWN